ncbi:hypothetical protein M436DRAFT_56198 [Aureobasidium namibiae CBS 147.97]|uniref:Pyridoxal phosphate homeostasis protein n=1 Tax=Aureobasidium namibiae CBS 147.97 TaxID=1043004 RepID=A0A074W8G0_9PEZI|nr:uncharacterized protein M436DRAFT_56198 [Aureobasidium namibiae CBS 147.97]KEQ69400.1 hypothetical protein M436DRAFT_56198 [Aureobasidium namibiae CBS 147.97]
MPINPTRAKQLAENLSHVLSQIKSANTSGGQNVRLIAVSKLKPANDILALHTSASSPQTHFGENYVQELLEKSSLLPRTINWHFIGALQTNKCRPLAESIPNLFSVSSVDSSKKADQLEKGRVNLLQGDKGKEVAEGSKLRVLVQINTSGETEKSGVEPGAAAVQLCKHIRDDCPHLSLGGLMTIGAIARSKATTAETENEDFDTLRKCRDHVAEQLGMQKEDLELSMGMSSDFEAAIRQGSTEVRVGTTIFGERPARGDAKVKEEVEEGKK